MQKASCASRRQRGHHQSSSAAPGLRRRALSAAGRQRRWYTRGHTSQHISLPLLPHTKHSSSSYSCCEVSTGRGGATATNSGTLLSRGELRGIHCSLPSSRMSSCVEVCDTSTRPNTLHAFSRHRVSRRDTAGTGQPGETRELETHLHLKDSVTAVYSYARADRQRRCHGNNTPLVGRARSWTRSRAWNRGSDETRQGPPTVPQISNTDWTHARTGQGPRSSGIEFATVVRRSGALGVEMETSRICT